MNPFTMFSSIYYQVIFIACAAIFTISNAQFGAMPMVAHGLDPRYHLGRSPLLPRQDGVCAGSNQHSCLDVNNSTVCCPDTTFCFVDTSYAALCCPIGSNCGYTACDTNHYQCKTTVTVSSSTSISPSCCPRSCTMTSQYLCAASYGGGCCSYDSSCLPSGSCAASTTTTSNPTQTTGNTCATTQTTCASSLGGGCCGTSSTCTLLSNTNYYCASGTIAAIRTGSNGLAYSTSSPSSSGLSTKAKAGIGAGIGVGGFLVIVGLVWFIIAHRRHAQSVAASQTHSQSQSQSHSNHNGNNKTPSASAAMSQGSSTGGGGGGGGGGGRPKPNRQTTGMTQSSDYFGPEAGVGPFTERNSMLMGISPGGWERGGVPARPQGPGDIIVPVEIDSSSSSPGEKEKKEKGNVKFEGMEGIAEKDGRERRDDDRRHDGKGPEGFIAELP